MKLELKTESWENLFETIRRQSFKGESNFWAAIQHLESQFEKGMQESSKSGREKSEGHTNSLNVGSNPTSCKKECMYSRSMEQEYPRKCLNCGKKEEKK